MLSVLFIAAGANHFLNSPFSVSIMPPYLPWHMALVYVSGMAEMGLGGLLLFPVLVPDGSAGADRALGRRVSRQHPHGVAPGTVSVGVAAWIMASTSASRSSDRLGLLVHQFFYPPKRTGWASEGFSKNFQGRCR